MTNSGNRNHTNVVASIYYEVPESSPLRIALCSTLRSLAKRWMALTEELNELDESLDKLPANMPVTFVTSLGRIADSCNIAGRCR